MKWLLIAFVTGVALVLWRMTVFANARMPKVGMPAPEFSLPDQHGNLRSSMEFRGKWLVLYFYPRDDSPGCVEQAVRYRDAMREIEALGAVVCGISVDNTESHADFARTYNLPYTLLTDRNGATAESFGSLVNLVVIKFARRNTFLITPEGSVSQVYLGVNPSRNAQEVMHDLSMQKA